MIVIFNEVSFDYKIYDGLSVTRNVTKLLEVLAYPESVMIKANQFAQHFTRVREWKNIGDT